MRRLLALIAILALLVTACDIDTQVAEDKGASEDTTAAELTVEPTSTIESEPTATPTAEPEATPTPVTDESSDDAADDATLDGIASEDDGIDDEELEETSGDIDVQVRDYNYRLSSFGTLSVFGELENHGDGYAEILEILVTLRNDDDTVMDAASSYTFVSVIGPGELAPFTVSFIDAEDTFTEIEIDIEARDAHAARFVIFERYRDFEVLQADWREGEWTNSIVGEIENVGDEAADLVQIFAVGYDTQGKIELVETTFAERDTIRSGARSPFTVDHFDDGIDEPAVLRIFAEGWVFED